MTETRDQRATISDAAATDAGRNTVSAQSASALNAPASGARSFGAALTMERERQGLSINEIAARLRLHPKQIAALEQEQFQQLPASAFVRGFVRNYAKELRLAPEALLAQVNARLPLDSRAVLAPWGSAAVRAASAERLSRGLAIFGIVGGLVVLGLVGWIAKAPRAPTAPAAAKAEAAPIPIPAPPATAVETAPLANAPQQATVAGANNADGAPVPAPTQKTTTAPALASNVPANSDGGAPLAASRTDDAAPTMNPAAAGTLNATAPTAPGKSSAGSNAIVTAAAPIATSAGPAVGTMRLVFGVRPSWLEVTQGDGRLLFSGINDPGSQRMLIGVPPLRLVIGNASTVALDYRGRRIDLKPMTSVDDVARITLESGTP